MYARRWTSLRPAISIVTVMANPIWKVYDERGEYIASCKHTEDAALLVLQHGAGAAVRYKHRFAVWTQKMPPLPLKSHREVDRVAGLILDRPLRAGADLSGAMPRPRRAATDGA